MTKFALAALALAFAAPASAAVLVADTGWQDDLLNSAGDPTDNSPRTFTVTALSILTITDDFVPGDIYVLSGDFDVATTFFAGSTSDVQAEGTYGAVWPNAAYSKLAILLAPGRHS